jgi:hypothetical protein
MMGLKDRLRRLEQQLREAGPDADSPEAALQTRALEVGFALDVARMDASIIPFDDSARSRRLYKHLAELESAYAKVSPDSETFDPAYRPPADLLANDAWMRDDDDLTEPCSI